MAGYIRQDTTNNIADGNIINASDFDNEYNAIEAAFHATTGHTHDGTAAEGAPITKIGPAQDVIASAVALTPKVDNTIDLGSATFEYKDLFIDGTANIDSLVADTADINGGTIDGVTIGGVSAGAATFTTVGATTGNITTVNATTVDTTNIEVTNIKAKDGTSAGSIADSTGIVTFASAILTTADINGGTLDNVTIGGSTSAAGTFTTVGATTGNITTVNATTVDTTNIEVSNIKAKDGTAAATIADSTGAFTVSTAFTGTQDSSFTSTGALLIPVGTTGQRPTGASGKLRFNTSTTKFEGHNGTSWTSVGGGATGAGADEIFIENGQTVTTSYSVTSGKNAMSTGPITINAGITVTVPSGSRWVVL